MSIQARMSRLLETWTDQDQEDAERWSAKGYGRAVHRAGAVLAEKMDREVREALGSIPGAVPATEKDLVLVAIGRIALKHKLHPQELAALASAGRTS